MRIFFLVFSVAVAFLWSVPVFAGTTGWVDLNNTKAVNAALSVATRNMGEYEYFKTIRCKNENGKILVKIDYNVIMTTGFFGVTWGSKDEIDSYFSHPERKRLRTRIRSRSDVEMKNGVFSCVIWFRPL